MELELELAVTSERFAWEAQSGVLVAHRQFLEMQHLSG
jgi:hypothetical protein